MLAIFTLGLGFSVGVIVGYVAMFRNTWDNAGGCLYLDISMMREQLEISGRTLLDFAKYYEAETFEVDFENVDWGVEVDGEGVHIDAKVTRATEVKFRPIL